MKSNIKFPGLFLVLCILITGCMGSSFNKKININNIKIILADVLDADLEYSDNYGNKGILKGGKR